MGQAELLHRRPLNGITIMAQYRKGTSLFFAVEDDSLRTHLQQSVLAAKLECHIQPGLYRTWRIAVPGNFVDVMSKGLTSRLEERCSIITPLHER
jgi:hypothetical protein